MTHERGKTQQVSSSALATQTSPRRSTRIASLIAACFALAAFTVAVAAGIASANPAASVLLRALLAMILCYPAGLIVGFVAQWLVNESVGSHRESNPAPNSMENEDVSHADLSPGEEEIIVV